MANKQDFVVKNGLTVLSTDISTGTSTGAIISQGGAGIAGDVNIGGTLRAGQSNFSAYDPNTWYVSDSTNSSDTANSGHSIFSSFKTIKHALSVAQPGDTVFIDPGTYTEIFPLTIPQGVSVRGAGLRETLVQPTTATNTLDAFYLNGETCISDFTVANFYKPGYAFKYANGAKVTTRSAYIERFSVITRGSVTSSSDPYGFNQGDAGNGAYIDGGIIDPTSLEGTMLFNEATFIVPNATGMYMTNGARSELVNSFFYFADKAIQAEVGPNGFGGIGKTKLRLGGTTGTFIVGDVLEYYSSTGTLVTTATISSVAGEYIYLNGPAWGIKTNAEAGTSTQAIFVSGGATATSVLLADYHEFGAELRSIGSAAVFGNTGITANGTGTDLKLIAFNLSHIGSGGDLSNDTSKTVQANEVIQINGGKVFYQTVDQNGDFRVGDAFFVNQRTGDVSFGTATVALSELANLTITDGVNNTVLLPTSITVGNLTFAGGSITSSVGDITIDPAGTLITLNSDVRTVGASTVTGILNVTNLTAATTNTGAVVIAGGVSIGGDLFVNGAKVGNNANTATNLLGGTLGSLPYQTGSGATAFIGIGSAGQVLISNGTTATWQVFTSTSGAVFINNDTSATSTASGALRVAGGAGIGGDLFVGGATYISGDLYVDGTQFAVNSNSIITGDKLLVLSSASTTAAFAANSGIQIGTGTGWASLLFNGSAAWISKGSIVPSASTYNLGSNTVPWNILYAGTIYDNNKRVITSVVPTAGLGIAITGLNSGGPDVQFVVTNTGVLSVIAGTDISVSDATGNVTISDTSKLQSVTNRGAATNNAIQITNGTSANSVSTGALVVSGGVGIGGNLYVQGTSYINGAQIWTTATLTDNNQLTNGANYLTSSTLGQYGVSALTAGAGIAISTATGAVTVTNIGVVSLQGSNFIAVSASSGSNVTVYNLGVTNITTGSGITVSTGTGTVNIASVDTLQLVTQRGATTNQAVAFTATNVSLNTSSGQAVLVSGGIGALRVVASEVYDNGQRVLTSVTPVGGTAISISAVSTSNGNTTFTVNNIGVTSAVGSTYLGVSASTGSVTFTNLGVQTLTAGTDTSVSASTGTVTVWTTSTLASVTSRGATTPSALTITNATQTTSTNTGALVVTGGLGVAGNGFIGGDFTIVGTLNATTVVGAISTASNLQGGALGSIPYQTAAGTTRFIGIGSSGNILQAGATTATWVSTGSLVVGAAQIAQTATNIIGGLVNATTGRFSGVTTVTNATASVGTNSGALQVVGGAGIAGSVYAGQLYDNNNRVVTSVVPTAGDSIGITSLISTGTNASFTISNLGVTATIGTTYLGVSTSTGAVVFTNLGVQTISGTTYLGASASTGTITLTNLGVQTLTAGTDTAVSAATGTVTVWNVSTLESVTGRGATTSKAISISNATASTSTLNGALTVAGGVGIGENLNVGGTMKVQGAVTFSSPVTFNGSATFVLSTNTYYTDNIIDLHGNPAGLGTPWVNDDGKDIGIRFNYYNRTIFTGTSGALVLANDTQFLEWYSAGTENAFTFASATYGKFKTGSITLVDTTDAINSQTGALVVAGGVGIGEKLYVGDLIYSGGSQVVTAATLGSFGVSQIIAGAAIGVTPTSGTGTVTISNLGVRSITTGSGISISTSTGTVIIQSIDTFQLVSQRGATSDQAISITNATASTSTDTGALKVVGGLGIGGNANIGGGITVRNASTFANGIDGTITTASNIVGGTAGALVYQSASGRTQFVGIGQAGYLLQSDGTVPTYVSTSTLQVGYANRAVTATNLSAGTAGQIVYQSSIGQTAYAGGSGTLGYVLASGGTGAPVFQNTLTLAGTVVASSTLTGALQVRGGVGIGGDLYVGGTAYISGSQVVTAANLSQFGVAQIVAGPYISVSPTGGTGTVTIGNLGVQQITTGSGINISTSTGTVNIFSVDTLQLVTQRGATTNQPIAFTATQLSSSTSTGQALLVSGGIGALAVYASNVFDNGVRVITSVTPVAGTGITVTNVSTSNANMSFQVNNSGVTSAIGTTYLGVSASSGTVTFTNLGVQTLTAGTDTAVSASTGTITVWSTATLQSITGRGNSTTNAIYIANATSATTTTNGALTVAGGIGVLGDIYARNIYTNGNIVGGQSSTSSNLAGGLAGDIVYQTGPGVTGFVNIGTAGQILYSNGLRPVWTNSGALLAGVAVTATNLSGGLAGYIPIQTANSTTSFISSGTNGQLLQMGTNTASWVTTTTLFVGSAIFANTATTLAGGTAGQVPYQSAIGVTSFAALGNVGEVFVSNGTGVPGFQNTLTLASTVNSVSTNSGAFQVRGGAGIGGNLWVGGTLYATIDGSISTATNMAGGSAGAIVYQTSVGKTSFIGIGPAGSVLYSNGSTATYISTTSLVVGAADSSKSSANITGGSLGQIPYQSGISQTAFINAGPTGSLLQSNGTTATFVSTLTIQVGYATTSTTAANIAGGVNGDLLYQSGAGTTSKLAIGAAGTILQSNGTTAQWFSTGTLLAGTTQNINLGKPGSIPFQVTTGTTDFIGVGSFGSILQVGAAGTATFVNSASITVGFANRANSSTFTADLVGGAAGQLAYQISVSDTGFITTGTEGTVLVSRPGVPVWQNTLTLAGSTQATSTNSGALQVVGGVGVGGNLYVGGTLFASVSGSITTATNVAGGTAGAILYQTGVGTTGFLTISPVAGTLLSSNGSNPTYISTTTLLVGDALRAQSVNNLTGGAQGSIPIQSGTGATAFIPIGPAGYLFQSNGTTATWISTGSLIAGTALAAYNIYGGAANQIPYQSGATATVFSSNFTFNGTALTVGGAVTAAQFVPNNATVPTAGIYGASNQIGIATNSINRMFFDNAGNVGIGNNTIPGATLDINGTLRASGTVFFTTATTATSALIGGVEIDGGLAVAKNVIIGGNYAAISTSTGALRVTGGAGVDGDLWARTIYSNSIDVVANAVIMATAFG